jgi:hypothetical protein
MGNATISNDTIIGQNKLKNSHISNQTKFTNIDTSKVVVAINTDNLEKKYDNLGDLKQTQDNIHESVNKLKNLKT